MKRPSVWPPGLFSAGLGFVGALAVFPFTVACGGDSNAGDQNGCTPYDQDGVIGGKRTVLVTVTDTAFSVGGVDSGSTERNIEIQNSTEVTLTVTNAGTKPHSFVVGCIPSGLPPGCSRTSCFPKAANIPPLDAGGSTTVEFVVPRVEGTYPVSSDVPGDEALAAEFVVN